MTERVGERFPRPSYSPFCCPPARAYPVGRVQVYTAESAEGRGHSRALPLREHTRLWDMVTATRYMVEKLEGRDEHRILNRDAPLCPTCGALLSGYDTRARHIVSSEGRSIWFRLRRLRCPVCCRLHLEVPDFVQAINTIPPI